MVAPHARRVGSGALTSTLHPIAFDATHSGLPCRRCGDVFRVPVHATIEALQAVGRARNAHELAAHAYVHIAADVPHEYRSTTSLGRWWGKKH